MPSRYPAEVRRQVVDLARSGTRVAQLSETFGISGRRPSTGSSRAIDRGEAPGLSTERFHNTRRRDSSLNMLTPTEFEDKQQPTTTAA
jgi:hypothetical protein